MEATKCANGHDQSEKNDQVAEDRYGGDLLAPFNNLANISTDDIITIGSLFKKRFTMIGHTVVTNRLWLKSAASNECDVLITFAPNVTYATVFAVLDHILKAGLIVHVKYHKTSHSLGLYISSSYERLLQGAEELELHKQIKANYGGGTKEFIFDEQEFYENIEHADKFLSTQEKQAIIFHILHQIRSHEELVLADHVRVSQGRKLIFYAEKKGIITQILPIHDQAKLKELRNEWVFSLVNRQPLDKVFDYFGVKLALYFAWVGFYTKALTMPAVLGLFIWFSMGKDSFHDSIYFLVLSAFNLVWSICFNDLWKRKCAEHAYQWATLDMKQDMLQEPRALFKGTYKLNKVNGKIEPHYSEWKRVLFRCLVTFPCLCVNIGCTVAAMLAMFQLQELINYCTKNGILPMLFGLTNFIPKMIYANLIGGLNSFYKHVCTWLNDKENYREELTHENHLIFKIIIFQFINSYMSLFYIAFYLRDIPLLRAQLFAIFLTRQLTGNLKESIIPYIVTNMSQLKTIDKSKRKDMFAEPNQDLIQNLDKLERYARNYWKTKNISVDQTSSKSTSDEQSDETLNATAGEISQPEVESMMPVYQDTFEDYLEMVMQFGLMVFFAPAFPLAALFSLINNVIEIRSDAFKMCYLHQRPFGQRVATIGTWQNVLEVFAALGIVVNCGLLVTFQVVDNLVPEMSFMQCIAIVIVIEHIFFAFNQLLSYAIPDVPRWIIVEMSKLEFRRRNALRQIECKKIQDMKKQQQSSTNTDTITDNRS